MMAKALITLPGIDIQSINKKNQAKSGLQSITNNGNDFGDWIFEI